MGPNQLNATLDASLGPSLADISKHLYALFPPEFTQQFPDAKIEVAYGLADKGPGAARLFNALNEIEAAAAFALIRSKAQCNCYVGPALRDGGLHKRASKADVGLTAFAWCDFDAEGDEVRVTEHLKVAGLKPAILVQTGTIPCSRFQIYFRLDQALPAIDVEVINTALRTWLGGDDVDNADRVMRLAGTLSYPSIKKAERGYLVERTVLKLVPNAPRYSAKVLLEAAGSEGGINREPASFWKNNALAEHLAKGNGADRPSPRSPRSPYLAYAADTESRKGRDADEIQALLEASQIDHQWHNNMVRATASMAGKGWTIEAMQMACGPYCDDGPHDRELAVLINGAVTKFGKDENEARQTGHFDRQMSRLETKAKRDEHRETTWQPPQWLDMADWDHLPVPEREWAIPDRVPLNQAGLFSGEGGTGKSIIELMKDVAHVASRDWMGSLPAPGAAFYIGCEDDRNELHIRLAAILKHFEISFADAIAGGLHVLPLLGQDAVLCAANPRSGRVEVTELYRWLFEQAGDLKPRNISVDTLSRAFAGNEIDRSQVYEFSMHMQALAKVGSGSVTILSHPSQAGKASGDGYSGSTAWHGAFRFRQYLTTPKLDDSNNITQDADQPQSALRELQFKKNQYGPLGQSIILEYRNGLFIPVHGQSGLERLAHKEKAKNLFLELLERFNRQGVNVSHKKQSRNGAPNLFAETPEAQRAKIRKDDFNTAMGELFAADQIHVEKYRSANKYEYERLVAGGITNG